MLLKNFCIFCILSPDSSQDYSLLFSIMQCSFITMHTWKYLKLALLLLKDLHECREENREKLLIQERSILLGLGTKSGAWLTGPLPLPSEKATACSAIEDTAVGQHGKKHRDTERSTGNYWSIQSPSFFSSLFTKSLCLGLAVQCIADAPVGAPDGNTAKVSLPCGHLSCRCWPLNLPTTLQHV